MGMNCVRLPMNSKLSFYSNLGDILYNATGDGLCELRTLYMYKIGDSRYLDIPDAGVLDVVFPYIIFE